MADDQFNASSSLLSDEQIALIFKAANETSYMASGAGSKYSQIPLFLQNFDKLGYNILMPNQELVGYTFITRPHLNMSTSNLRQSRQMQLFDTLDRNTYGYAIRSCLDPVFASASIDSNKDFIDYRNPFIVPMTNCLQALSGWPDYTIETETTEGGYFSEDLTFVRGSDRCARTYDLTATLRDIPGGYMFALLLAWTTFMAEVTRGTMVAYPWDIDSNRLCYTSSIYRFVTDPSKRYITRWAKATGCFPRAIPVGDIFNFGEGEWYVESTKQYSVPFVANHVSYMDPAVFLDFNRLVRRYCTNVDSLQVCPEGAMYNYRGIPYIDTTGGRNQLLWLIDQDELADPMDEVMGSYRDQLATALSNRAAEAQQQEL